MKYNYKLITRLIGMLCGGLLVIAGSIYLIFKYLPLEYAVWVLLGLTFVLTKISKTNKQNAVSRISGVDWQQKDSNVIIDSICETKKIQLDQLAQMVDIPLEKLQAIKGGQEIPSPELKQKLLKMIFVVEEPKNQKS